ncbi:galactose-binding domain-like protein [Fimicolochytrium jonesii]|uniref:galactose-binding domain-like protein n=1 Tax=Fimicolochytrium jonesii TaxID=1396493 RepID=UPI0022FE7CF0|nr:galactose-binding domain-like protein [Fimicolochytrium jonesii]KAI8820091.1 galactose-binding domain-like protein [Fimicolochytrium jonesii]
MSHCHDEHHDHRGGGGHGHGHDHDHDHDHDGPDRGSEYTLYQQVDLDNVTCLNESDDGAIKKVFKTWDQRNDRTTFVESDVDEQLIVHIPFTANIKLKSIAVVGGPGEEAPASMKAYVNRADLDFDTAEATPPAQEWELVHGDTTSTAAALIPEYPTRMTKFQNVRHLTLYFPSNFGAEVTRIFYIGLKGEWDVIKKDPVITVYEVRYGRFEQLPHLSDIGLDSVSLHPLAKLAANPADHKTKADNFAGSMIQ